jgi:hypothetical protein
LLSSLFRSLRPTTRSSCPYGAQYSTLLPRTPSRRALDTSPPIFVALSSPLQRIVFLRSSTSARHSESAAGDLSYCLGVGMSARQLAAPSLMQDRGSALDNFKPLSQDGDRSRRHSGRRSDGLRRSPATKGRMNSRSSPLFLPFPHSPLSHIPTLSRSILRCLPNEATPSFRTS